MVAEIVGGLMLGSWHWSPTGCTCRPDAPDVVGAVRFDPLGDRPHQFAGPGHHAAVISLVSDRPAELGADLLVTCACMGLSEYAADDRD
jgi:hypothetical protein